jgi:hypothetical protein
MPVDMIANRPMTAANPGDYRRDNFLTMAASNTGSNFSSQNRLKHVSQEAIINAFHSRQRVKTSSLAKRDSAAAKTLTSPFMNAYVKANSRFKKRLGTEPQILACPEEFTPVKNPNESTAFGSGPISSNEVPTHAETVMNLGSSKTISRIISSKRRSLKLTKDKNYYNSIYSYKTLNGRGSGSKSSKKVWLRDANKLFTQTPADISGFRQTVGESEQ